jgi:hypothetical protein
MSTSAFNSSLLGSKMFRQVRLFAQLKQLFPTATVVFDETPVVEGNLPGVGRITPLCHWACTNLVGTRSVGVVHR